MDKNSQNWIFFYSFFMSNLTCLWNSTSFAKCIFVICRISGNAASNKNIHGTVSEQLKKNFAKSRWKVFMISILFHFCCLVRKPRCSTGQSNVEEDFIYFSLVYNPVLLILESLYKMRIYLREALSISCNGKFWIILY